MRIGHFDETEQNDNVDDTEDMDKNMDDADADMDDADEDMDDAEDDMDSPEDGEDADEGENAGEEKHSIADMIKDKLSSLFKSKETDDRGEGDETKEAGEEDETDEGDDADEESEKEQDRPSWELASEDKAAFNDKAAEIAGEYREKHGLDEHGNKLENSESSADDTENDDDTEAKTHGDGGERVREAPREINDGELEH